MQSFFLTGMSALSGSEDGAGMACLAFVKALDPHAPVTTPVDHRREEEA
ncbi:MAG: hypothetical protein ACO3JV_10750 [Pseudomonadales bacterium]